jgi:ribosome-binding factor A
MNEGKRQKQVAAVLQEEFNTIFRKLGLSMILNGMVSISSIKITPDLLEARVYLSLFKIEDKNKALQIIENKAWEIKKELGNVVGKQLRRMPVIKYYIDDTLDYVFNMEEVFKKINEAETPS